MRYSSHDTRVFLPSLIVYIGVLYIMCISFWELCFRALSSSILKEILSCSQTLHRLELPGGLWPVLAYNSHFNPRATNFYCTELFDAVESVAYPGFGRQSFLLSPRFRESEYLKAAHTRYRASFVKVPRSLSQLPLLLSLSSFLLLLSLVPSINLNGSHRTNGWSLTSVVHFP